MCQETERPSNLLMGTAPVSTQAVCASASALAQFLVGLENECPFSVKDCLIVTDNAASIGSPLSVSLSMSVSVSLSSHTGRTTGSGSGRRRPNRGAGSGSSTSNTISQGRRSSRSSRARKQAEEAEDGEGQAPPCRWQSYPVVTRRSASPQRQTQKPTQAQAPLRRMGTYPLTPASTTATATNRPPRRPTRRSSLTKPIPIVAKEAFHVKVDLVQGMAEIRKLAAELQDDTTTDESDYNTDASDDESIGCSSSDDEEEDGQSPMYYTNY